MNGLVALFERVTEEWRTRPANDYRVLSVFLAEHPDVRALASNAGRPDRLRETAQKLVDGWFGAGFDPDLFHDLRAALSEPET